MEYKYFVSYACKTDDSYGFGNSIVQRKNPITSERDIDEIQETIKGRFGYTEVILVSFSLIKDD